MLRGRGLWLVAAAMVALEGGLAAQEPSSKPTIRSIALSVRGDYYANQDLLVSPRTHDGLGFGQGGVLMTLQTTQTYHELDVWFGTLTTSADGGFSYDVDGRRVQTPDSEVDLGEVSYSYLRRLSDWWWGVSARFEASHTKYEFGSGSAEGFFYFAGLQLAGRREADVGDGGKVAVSLRVPVVGWVARPLFSTVDEARLKASSSFLHRVQKGGVAWPGNLQAVWTRLSFEHPVSEHLGFRGAFRLGYARHSGRRFPDHSRFAAIRAGVDLGIHILWAGGDQ